MIRDRLDPRFTGLLSETQQRADDLPRRRMTPEYHVWVDRGHYWSSWREFLRLPEKPAYLFKSLQWLHGITAIEELEPKRMTPTADRGLRARNRPLSRRGSR